MKQAIILAGGRGERLRPLTESRPKCMVEFLSRPILAYQLNWLRNAGVRHAVIACGYLHEAIQDYFGDGSKIGVKLSYVVETEPLGRGGALKNALLTLPPCSEPIIAANGDNISNVPLDRLLDFHVKNQPLATVVTVPLRSPYGIVDHDENGTVSGFREKPLLPYGINAGIYLLDYRIVNHLPDKGDHEVDTFPKLAADGLLRAFRSDALWRTVDTMKDVEELRLELENILLGALFQKVT